MLKKAELFFQVDGETHLKLSIYERNGDYLMEETSYTDSGTILTQNQKTVKSEKSVAEHISSRLLKITT